MTNKAIVDNTADHNRARALGICLGASIAACATGLRIRARALIERLVAVPENDPTAHFTNREWADLPTYHPPSDPD
ncbi:hypothetical protein ACFSQT_34235 [Mesorhizobium calcicola]|uniref:Uncharacterized protein n=1 Tax=Mesorhizobium calcicola TaxID=1300310 RepID=A0ABW4WQV2_9HYPH